jgi:pSer/pThr/pTyr-binding forkhead associated (FHA) protein
MRDPDERPTNDAGDDHPQQGGIPDDATAQLDAVKPAMVAADAPVEAPQQEPPDVPAEPAEPPAPPVGAADAALDADHEPDDGDASDAAPAPQPESIMATPRVAIVRLSGANDGEVTPVASDAIIIGRMADDLTVTLRRDPWVSRRHARVSFRDGGWWLEDLGSSNGTFIGDQRDEVTAPTLLPLREVFRVGHTDLMLSDDADYLSQGARHV